MAKYASQPSFPQSQPSPGGGMLPGFGSSGIGSINRFSFSTPFGGGMKLPQSPQMANPLRGVRPGQQGLATPDGIAKAALDELLAAALFVGMPETGSAMGPATMSKAGSAFTTGATNTGSVASTGAVKTGSASRTVRSQRLGNTLMTGDYSSFDLEMLKFAMMPTPGLTANQPAPQPGMAPTPPPLPAMPPPNGGAPITQGAGQPALDPNTGQPLPPPTGDPAAQGQPPAPPPQPGAIDPMSGMPVSSPMQDPPPPPLPMNPRMSPPRPQNAHDTQRMGMRDDLFADMHQANNPVGIGAATDDLTSQAEGMGASVKEAAVPNWLAKLMITAANVTGVGADMAGVSAGPDLPERPPIVAKGTPKIMPGGRMPPPPRVSIKPRGKLGLLAGGLGLAGLGLGATKTAAEKQAAPTKQGGDMEKVANPLLKGLGAVGNFGRGMFGAAQKAAPGMAHSPFLNPAYRSGAVVRQGMQAAGPQTGSTLAGGAAGYFTGDDLGIGREGGAFAGMAAFNPYLRRMATQSGAMNAPMSAFRRASFGGLGGSTVDAGLGAVGVDTGGQFGRAGARLGLGSGLLGVGANRLGANLRQTGQMPWLRNNVLSPISKLDRRAAGAANNFATGFFTPVAETAKAVVRKPLQWAGFQAPQGLRAGSNISAAGMPFARKAGVLGGGTALAATGLGAGYNTLRNQVAGDAQATLADTYNQALPVMQEDMAGFLDHYGKTRGFIGGHGQFDPASAVSKNSGLDSLISQLGMDPARMSPIQKLMLVGGGGTAAGGLLAGSPMLAGLGGGGAMMSMLPSLLGGKGQQSQGGQAPGPGGVPQVNSPQYRDEWELMQQLANRGGGA
jgi:hypothetical protein